MILNPDWQMFYQVVLDLNISKTADRLNKRQSGISKTIQRLEFQIDQKLFVRQKKGLILTEVGQHYFEIVDQAQAWLSKNLENKNLEIKIGVNSSIGATIIPLIPTYQNYSFNYVFDSSRLITRHVLDCLIDVGIVANPKPYSELVIKKIIKDEVNLWSTKRSTSEEPLFYHPGMQKVDSILKKLSWNDQRAIADYEVIANTVLVRGGTGLLPEVVALRYPQLKKQSDSFFDSRICIIYRQDFLSKTKKSLIQYVINKIQAHTGHRQAL